MYVIALCIQFKLILSECYMYKWWMSNMRRCICELTCYQLLGEAATWQAISGSVSSLNEWPRCGTSSAASRRRATRTGESTSATATPASSPMQRASMAMADRRARREASEPRGEDFLSRPPLESSEKSSERRFMRSPFLGYTCRSVQCSSIGLNSLARMRLNDARRGMLCDCVVFAWLLACCRFYFHIACMVADLFAELPLESIKLDGIYGVDRENGISSRGRVLSSHKY